jgi:hypothetical protein
MVFIVFLSTSMSPLLTSPILSNMQWPLRLTQPLTSPELDTTSFNNLQNNSLNNGKDIARTFQNQRWEQRMTKQEKLQQIRKCCFRHDFWATEFEFDSCIVCSVKNVLIRLSLGQFLSTFHRFYFYKPIYSPLITSQLIVQVNDRAASRQ